MIHKKPNINLFIVGAAKSGTTSLYHYLNQHPDVFFPKVKEPNYYSNIESEDRMVYENPKEGVFYHNKIINDQNIYYSLYKNSFNYKVIGDASPSYLWDTKSAQMIYDNFPNAKIIIVLRNPIKRTYSHYLMNIKSGVEKENNFLTALKRDKKTKPKVWGGGKVLLYEELGMYHKQVKTYFNTFDKKNIKIIIYEDFFKNIDEGLNDIYAFLNIKKTDKVDSKIRYNQFVSPKNSMAKFLLQQKTKLSLIRKLIPKKIINSFKNKFLLQKAIKPDMDKNSKRYLSEVFSEDILKLEELLGQKFDGWKKKGL